MAPTKTYEHHTLDYHHGVEATDSERKQLVHIRET